MKYYLAIDIGASSGRHILAHLEDGKIVLEEIYRFPNSPVLRDGCLCWDTEVLFSEIVQGLKQCRELGKLPEYVGIDTWGVDYVLLDEADRVIGPAVSYRDGRTKGVREQVYDIIPSDELYSKTGIQPQVFNTVFQLYTDRQKTFSASSLLFIPEYFSFLLTGVKKTEYTVASTSGLLDVRTKSWDNDIISALGINPAVFSDISMPGELLGEFTDRIADSVGFSAKVVLPCMHDTASAVLSLPSNKKSVYISSGTWSLMGTEIDVPICTPDSLSRGFTNEGGMNGVYRYLKNIMGLWMIQSLRRQQSVKYSFDELCAMAEEKKDFSTVIDVNDLSFLAPENMYDAVVEYCRSHSLAAPTDLGEAVKCIYVSLAKSYAQTVRELEEMTGCTYDVIHIVGGGSKDEYLNRLTALYTGKPVLAGPTEATAIGNILAQMLSCGELSSVAEARDIVARSFEIKKYI